MKKIISILLLFMVSCNLATFNAIRNKVFYRIERSFSIVSLFGKEIYDDVFYLGAISIEDTMYYEVSEIDNRKLKKVKIPLIKSSIIMDSEKPYLTIILNTKYKNAELACFDSSLTNTMDSIRSISCWSYFDETPDIDFEIHIPENSFLVLSDKRGTK
jgi:hypothetical protein